MNKQAISSRAQNTPASAVRKLVPLAVEAKKRGISVYHVNIGQPDLPTPPEILKRIREFSGKTLEYAPSQGLKETIEGWSEFYRKKQFPFEEKDIIVTSGGSEGLVFSFFAICDPGDELIVFEPFYTSYSIAAAMGNITLKAVETKAENGFHLPERSAIEGKITRKTRGIIVCNPNNPTGTVYTHAEVQMLADIAIKHNLYLISDETYQEIVFDGKHVLPFASFKKLLPKLIICDSVSKRFNACGARVGCIASKNEELMSALLRFAQSRLSVATIDQYAVVPMLHNHSVYVDSVRKTYEARRNTVLQALANIDSISFVKPEGAFYIIPKLPITDSDDFAAYLLNEFSDKKQTVMIAPATGFYITRGLGKTEVRIAYVLEDKKLERAIELLGLALLKYKKKAKNSYD